MSMFRTVFSLSLLSASLAFAGWTQQGDASATFDAKGPAGFKIHGEAKKLGVVDDGKALTVNLTLKDIDTDNDLRNKHMFEDIGAEQFPQMSLSVPLDALKSADGANTAEATGTVTLHGQTKQVPFKYTATCKGGTCAVEGSANLNLSDYGIKIRSYLGITVKPDVVVGAKFSVKK